jgi:ADP-dependent NAD(P)H-hydrate dehydratase / NAD(P)H-hydrate epimerase
MPVPTGAEAAAFDARAQSAGVSGAVLMESAGRAAADVAAEMLGDARRGGPVLVLAGAGNNGGDALVLARTLHARGIPVRVLADPRRADPDPLLHGHTLDSRRLSPDPESGAPEMDDGATPRLIVDGLLGTGLASAPREPMAGWIRALNALAEGTGAPVLSLDVPSGVLADSGQVPGDAVRAAVTVAFGAPKLGTLLHPGRARAGRMAVVEIGFPPWPGDGATGRLVTGEWARAVYPLRKLRTHKNEAGRMLLVAGGESMGGAAILAARAALRSGVGMLRVLCHPSHREAFHAGVPEAILPDPDDPEAALAALGASDALVAGPGMGLDPDALPGRHLQALLTRAAQGGERERAGAGDVTGIGILLDADALTLLAQGALRLPVTGSERVLLTPHPGEWARLVGDPERGVPDDVAAGAREAARRFGATCLLKGTPSIVAGPGPHAVRVSASGSSALARGGMGDVLTGVAGALLARGLGAADAGSLALHLTGRAADLAGGGDALLPSDLIEGVAAAIGELRETAPATAGASDPPFRAAAVLVDLAAPR